MGSDMTVPSLPPTQSAAVAPVSWPNDARTMLGWFRDDAPAFRHKAYARDASSNINRVEHNTLTTFGFGDDTAASPGWFYTPGSGAAPRSFVVGNWLPKVAEANPSSLLVPEAGIYWLKAWVEFSPSAAGQFWVILMVNGSAITEGSSVNEAVSPTASTVRVETSDLLDLSANDEIDIQVYQSTGSAITSVDVWLAADWRRASPV